WPKAPVPPRWRRSCSSVSDCAAVRRPCRSPVATSIRRCLPGCWLAADRTHHGDAMGLLIDGQWQDQWYETSGDGEFRREEATFRDWLTADGGAGPAGQRGHRAEPGRYRLYVSYACPWAHRTLIMRALKGLEDLVPVSVVHWRMLEHRWTFEAGPGLAPGPVMGAASPNQPYAGGRPGVSARPHRTLL